MDGSQEDDKGMKDLDDEGHLRDENSEPMDYPDSTRNLFKDEDQESTFRNPGGSLEKFNTNGGEDVGEVLPPRNAVDEGFYDALDVVEEVAAEDTCKLCDSPFLNLPREVRDQVRTLTSNTSCPAYHGSNDLPLQIHGYVVALPTPMSDRESQFKCPSKSCAGKPMPDQTAWRSRYKQAREYLYISSQIRTEALDVFFRINSFALHRARLREDPDMDTTALANDTQSMYAKYRRRTFMRRFKHLKMDICLSPIAFVDLGMPKELLNSSNHAKLLAYQLRQDPVRLSRHTRDEDAQCELFRLALAGLVRNQKKTFPQLQTLTLDISLHTPQPSYLTSNSVLDRCGITFQIRVFVNTSEDANYTPGRPTRELRAPKDNVIIKSQEVNGLEPKRFMLAPLVGLSGVQKVEVKRRWVVIHRSKGAKPTGCKNEDGTIQEDNVLASYMAQVHRFSSVEQMLAKAEKELTLFQVTGLKKFNIAEEDVIEILENEGEGLPCEYELSW